MAWFAIASVLDKPITVYGDGKQVRDILWVDDLSRAYEAAIFHQDTVNGHAINIGGGPTNVLSLLELISRLRKTLRKDIQIDWGDWRSGDQPVFVCNIEKAKALLKWQPEIDIEIGLEKLIAWIHDNRSILRGASKS